MSARLAVVFLALFAVRCLMADDLLLVAREGGGVPFQYVPGLRSLTPYDLTAIRDGEGRTLLHWAAARGHQIRTYALLAAGADARVVDHSGRTPLHDVLEFARQEKGDTIATIVESLVLSGADVNAKSSEGWTPLALAARHGDAASAEYLLWHGAAMDPTGVPADKLPRAVAAGSDQAAVAQIFRSAGGSSPAEPGRLNPRTAESAVRAADLNGVIDALNAGWKINELDREGRTAMFRAVSDRRPDLVNLLIHAGADPNIANPKGVTPLMVALSEVGMANDRMVINLLFGGADPHAVAKDGRSCLVFAAGAGYDWGVLLLAAAGADPRLPTPRGSLANWASHPPTRGILSRFNVVADPDAERPLPQSPAVRLVEAAKRGDVPAVTRLLDEGVPVDSVVAKNDQRTALVWAADYGHLDVVDLLIARSADVNRQTPKSGWHLIHDLAARHRVDSGNEVGRAAAKTIQALIQRGVRVDVKNKAGMTALMIAASRGALGPNTQALIDAGADLNARNAEGRSVLQIARDHGHWEMFEFLKQRGARE
jgi:ankyrin repeat protein